MPLTDLEICQKLAEIENYKGWEKMSTRGIRGVFNPLTDDGLCFLLMLKHDIKLSRNSSNEHVGMWSHCRGEDDKSPNKAICLAIIEKHKNRN